MLMLPVTALNEALAAFVTLVVVFSTGLVTAIVALIVVDVTGFAIL